MEINGLYVKFYFFELWWFLFMKWLGIVLEYWGRIGCGLISFFDFDIGIDFDFGIVCGNWGCLFVINICYNLYIFFKN